MPAVEAMMRFSARRHDLIVSNIANLSTPNYQPKDVSPKDFQAALGEAIDERRGRNGGVSGDLAFDGTAEAKRDSTGRLTLRPDTPSGNVLFHDRNNRDLERTMQALVENAGVFRVASQYFQKHHQTMRLAISERV